MSFEIEMVDDDDLESINKKIKSDRNKKTKVIHKKFTKEHTAKNRERDESQIVVSAKDFVVPSSPEPELCTLVPEEYDEKDEEEYTKNAKTLADFFPKVQGKFKKNVNLRQSGQEVNYTPEMLQEYIRCKQDIIYFVENYFTIIEPDKGKIVIKLREYQKKILKSFVEVDDIKRKNRILLAARQIGKTTITTAYILWYILFNEDKLVAILANKEKTAKEVLARVKLGYENLPIWLQQGVADDGWSSISMKLENGNRVIASSTASSAIRGFTINLGFLDEMAHVPPNIIEEFWTSVYPTVSAGKSSRFIVVSCVVGNTLVITQKGFQRVGDFKDISREGAYRVKPYWVLGKDKKRLSNIFVDSGKVDTVKFFTLYGDLECSMVHKLLIEESPKVYTWKEAKDITSEDKLVFQVGMDIWGRRDSLPIRLKSSTRYDTGTNLTVLDDQLAYFIGLVCYKGSVSNPRRLRGGGDRRVTLTTKMNLVNFITKELELPLTSIKKNTRYGFYEHLMHNTDLVNFFNGIGVNTVDGINLPDGLPPMLLQLKKDLMIQLIRGIFDGVSMKKEASSHRQLKTVSIESSKSVFIEDVRTLLLNLGISSRLKHRVKQTGYTKRVRNAYILWLAPTEVRKFIKIVGTNSPLRKKQFDEWEKIAYGFKIKENKLKGLVTTKYRKKEYGQNEVFDFSLNHDDNDEYCHSIIYNNFVGHQTPNGINRFYHIYKEAEMAKNSFVALKVNWWELPERDNEWKEATIRDIGQLKFAVEYECRFLGSSSTLISGDILEKISTGFSEPLSFSYGYLMSIYEEPQQGAFYIMGVDTSHGIGKDYSVIQVLRFRTKYSVEQVAVYRCNTIIPHDYAYICDAISKYYNNAYMMIESNDVGGEVINTLYYEIENEEILNCGNHGGMGIRSSRKTKSSATANLKRYIENGYLKLHDRDTLTELTVFEEISPGIFAAKGNDHDDTIAALFWGLYFVQTEFCEFDETNEVGINTKLEVTRNRTSEDEPPMILGNDFRNIDEDGFEWDDDF